MLTTCQQIYKYAREDIPVTIYYAFKQSDTDEKGTASSGWETMLSAIIQSGFSITGTWPMRTEKPGRSLSIGTNALASSIVLVCRKRQAEAPVCTRKQFQRGLRAELAPPVVVDAFAFLRGTLELAGGTRQVATDLDLGTLDVPYSTVTVHVRNALGDPVPAATVTLGSASDPMMSSFTSTVDLGNGLTGTARTYNAWAATNSSGTATSW